MQKHTTISTRREQRTDIAVIVEVCGFDKSGHFFAEHTATLNVSTNGCCFRLRAEIAPDAQLAVQPVSTEPGATAQPVLYNIAWLELLENGALVGASRVQGQTSWCVAFPAAKSSHEPMA